MFQFPRYASRRAMYSLDSNWALPQLGFPIRKSPDQSSFAAPRSLSQLTTSFIVSQSQGIHHTPLSALKELLLLLKYSIYNLLSQYVKELKPIKWITDKADVKVMNL